MDFDQITTFVEVAHAGSFSKAAQKLYRTQPAISTQVRLLEKNCGQPLFLRQARRVELTVAGRILLRYGERLRELHAAALGDLDQMRRHPRGRVVLAANEATVLYNLACVYALEGREGRALRWLETAMERGFENFSHMMADADLESLRDTPAFGRLLRSRGIVALPPRGGGAAEPLNP